MRVSHKFWDIFPIVQRNTRTHSQTCKNVIAPPSHLSAGDHLNTKPQKERHSAFYYRLGIELSKYFCFNRISVPCGVAAGDRWELLMENTLFCCILSEHTGEVFHQTQQTWLKTVKKSWKQPHKNKMPNLQPYQI